MILFSEEMIRLTTACEQAGQADKLDQILWANLEDLRDFKI